jgi:hypothetical protein
MMGRKVREAASCNDGAATAVTEYDYDQAGGSDAPRSG